MHTDCTAACAGSAVSCRRSKKEVKNDDRRNLEPARFLIAILLGGLIGILISECRPGAKPTLAVVSFLYTIPSISMLGFLIPFSGVGNLTAVIALTIYALLPMVRKSLRPKGQTAYSNLRKFQQPMLCIR